MDLCHTGLLSPSIVISRLAAVTAVMKVARLSEALFEEETACWRRLYVCAWIEMYEGTAIATFRLS